MVGCLAGNSAIPHLLETEFRDLSQRRLVRVLRLFAVDSKKLLNRKNLARVKSYKILNFFTAHPQSSRLNCE